MIGERRRRLCRRGKLRQGRTMDSLPPAARVRPVILAGGSGTRLWPMSTAATPKHLLPLIGDTSLFEQTVARFADAARYAPPLVIANQAQGDVLRDLLAPIDGARLVLE